jgi:hypothetical protein
VPRLQSSPLNWKNDHFQIKKLESCEKLLRFYGIDEPRKNFSAFFLGSWDKHIIQVPLRYVKAYLGFSIYCRRHTVGQILNQFYHLYFVFTLSNMDGNTMIFLCFWYKSVYEIRNEFEFGFELPTAEIGLQYRETEVKFMNVLFRWGFWALSWEFSDLRFLYGFLKPKEGVSFSIRFSSFPPLQCSVTEL